MSAFRRHEVVRPLRRAQKSAAEFRTTFDPKLVGRLLSVVKAAQEWESAYHAWLGSDKSVRDMRKNGDNLALSHLLTALEGLRGLMDTRGLIDLTALPSEGEE
jgi:hypothetical protein